MIKTVTIYVSGDGSGSYNCDGVNDQYQINQALEYADNHPGTIVYLKGPFVYKISSSIEVGWSTKLTGDSSACVKLVDNANWAAGIPLIHQIWGDIEDVEIYGFEIDGNAGNQSQARGDSYYMLMYFHDADNISVHDMYLHDALGDGLRTLTASRIYFYNNTVKRLGHDGSYFEYTETGEVHHNITEIQTNSAHRVKDSSNIKIHDNTMKPYALTSVSGNPGIEIEDSNGSTYNIEVCNNVLTDCWGEGIWVIERNTGNSNQNKNLYIHHNTIRACGHITTIDYNAGITIQGFSGARIESNIIEGCYNAGILCRYTPLTAGGSIYIRNNQISNTQKTNSGTFATSNAAWTGSGVVNLFSDRYTMILTSNTVTGSAGLSNYYGVSYLNDNLITSDPKYVPPIQYTAQEIGIDYYIPGRTAYINGYPFNWTEKKIDVDKTMGQLKSPGVDGWSLEDYGFEGADITIDCYANSFNDMIQAIAAFYQEGRSVLELGGIYQGWQIYGYCKNHSTELRLSEQKYEHNYPYSVLFLSDAPIMQSVQQRVRGRKVTWNGEEFSSDNVFTGNIIKNSSFENWANTTNFLSWKCDAPTINIFTWDGNLVMSTDGNYIIHPSPLTPVPAQEWRAVCWSPALNLFCAVAQTGTEGRAMTSPDGSNWTARVTPIQNWRNVVWAPALNLFCAVGISGTLNRVMTSPNGIDWTNRTTPAGDYNWVGLCWSPELTLFVATAVTGTGNRVMTSPNGTTWTLRTTPADLNWTEVCWSPELTLFVAVAYGGGSSLVMTSPNGIDWTQRSTPLNQQWCSICWSAALTLFVAVSDSGSAQQVMTSPDGINWTARSTPVSVGWRSVRWSPEVGLFIAVANSGIRTRSMSSTDGIYWTIRTTTTFEKTWYGLCWSPELSMFAACATSGTGNYVMTTNDYGTLKYLDVPPDDWDIVNTGQERSSTAVVDLYSLVIEGDGITDHIGEITQPTKFEAGLTYVLSAYVKIEGLTSGYLQIDVFSGGMITKSIACVENCDWTLKQVTMLFDTVPYDAKIRIYGGGGVSLGAKLYVDNLILQKVSDFEVATVGNDILTHGTIDVIPDYIIEACPLEGGAVSGVTYPYYPSPNVTYSTYQTGWTVQFSDIFPEMLWTKYRFDQISWNIKGQASSYYAYCKVTIQAASLYGGVETQIAETHVKNTNWVGYVTNLNILSAASEQVIIRWYIKTDNTNYRAYITNFAIIYTQIGVSATASNVSLYNTRDPLIKLNAANVLFAGCKISVNADQTGVFSFSENFADATYQTVSYSRSNDIYLPIDHNLVLNSGGSLVYGFNTSYPITGIPYVVLYVVLGSPQIQIAADNNGAPGTWYSIDTNSNTDITNTQTYRKLDNELNFRLKGNSIWYMKILPQSGETCTIGSIYVHCDLLTVDAERPKIYATGTANTYHADMTGYSPCIITMKYRDAHMVI